MPHPQTRDRCARPAFLTGTSSEYLGRRPLPRVLRGRTHVVVLGPVASGKTAVARRLGGPDALWLDKHATQGAIVHHVRNRAWSDALINATALVLDGPVWLSHRPAAVAALRELLDMREAAGLRTLVCQDPRGGSVYPLFDARPPGSTVIIGLRFPEGRRGRRRFAQRQCQALDLPLTLARGLDRLDPWSYDRVIATLRARAPTG